MSNNLKQTKNHKIVYFLLSILLCLSMPSLSLAQKSTNEPVRKRRVNEQKTFVLSEKGAPLEQNLVAGENHTYQIYLNQGDYLSLGITRKDADLVANFFDPNGKSLLEISSSNRPYDPEIGLSLLIETLGTYRLTIAAKNPELKANYAIKIKELRPGNPQDKERISSQAAYSQAEKLRLQNTKESLQKAFDIYNSLLPIWQRLEDQEGEGATLNAISAIYFASGQYKESLQKLEQSLKIWREIKNPLWEVATLTSLGAVCNTMRENRQALYYYLKAQQVVNQLNEPQWTAYTLTGLGKICSDLGEFDQALNYYHQSLTIKQKLGDKRGEAIALSNVANSYTLLKDYNSALNYHLEALAHFHNIGDASGEASTLNNIGRSYMLLNDYSKALENFNLALNKKRELQDLRGEATTFNNIGYLHIINSEQKKSLSFISSSYFSCISKYKALEAFKQALAIWQKLDDPSEQQTTLSLITRTYTALGDKENSDNFSQQAMALNDVIKNNKNPNNVNVTPSSPEEIASVSSKPSSETLLQNTSQASNSSSTTTTPQLPTFTLPKLNNPDIASLPNISKRNSNTKNLTSEKAINKQEKPTNNPTNESSAKIEAPKSETSSKTLAKTNITSNTSTNEKGKFSIQVGALSNKEEADALCNRLRNTGLQSYVAQGTAAGKTVFRIRMGSFQSMEEAKKAAVQLKSKGAIGQYFIASQ